MRRWLPVGFLVVAALGGCAQPAALQPGDVVRPQLAVAPDAPWPGGCKAVIGMLVEIHRPGRSEVGFLRDEQVPPDAPTMQARLTFFSGENPLGEPLEVPFVHDC